MNDLTRYDPQTTQQLRVHINRVQEVMRGVMIKDVHYGTIPGTPKPTLYKAGAEVLLTTFHVAPAFRAEDLALDKSEVRYRVTCSGVHQGTGVTLGEGMGEASTREEKYAWRRAVCDAEFEATPSEDRRLKYAKGNGPAGSFYTIQQVRTNPADLANTVLKMANKRALVAMTLNVLAASDCFAQDLEDLPEGLDATEGAARKPAAKAKPATKAPQSSQAPPAEGEAAGEAQAVDKPATGPQVTLLRKKLDGAGIGENDFCKAFELTAIDTLPFGKVNEALAWIAANAP